MKIDCSAGKYPPLRQFKSLFLNVTGKACFTMGIAQHWLDTLKQGRCTTSLEEPITGPKWPPMYTNLCLNVSLANDTGRHINTNDGFNYFLSSGHLELVAIDILGLLTKTK